MATVFQAHRDPRAASRSRRDLGALILAIGTLAVLFALALAATVWPAAF
jgi:hypothetical protein